MCKILLCFAKIPFCSPTYLPLLFSSLSRWIFPSPSLPSPIYSFFSVLIHLPQFQPLIFLSPAHSTMGCIVFKYFYLLRSLSNVLFALRLYLVFPTQSLFLLLITISRDILGAHSMFTHTGWNAFVKALSPVMHYLMCYGLRNHIKGLVSTHI